MPYVGPAFVILAVIAAGCGAHHTSMHDAVLYASCGDRCKRIDVTLSNVRRTEDYATTDVRSKPPRHVPGAHVVLHRVKGDWDFVDAWTSFNGLTCADVAHQMRVPERVLHELQIC